MILTFTPLGQERAVELPADAGRQHAVAPPGHRCQCGHAAVVGGGKYVETRDTYAAVALCQKCGKRVGTFRAKVDTLFGIEEDERVYGMGIKIY